MRDRGRAVLLLTVVAGFASTIFLPLAGWLVAALGWREALLVLAALLAVLTIRPRAAAAPTPGGPGAPPGQGGAPAPDDPPVAHHVADGVPLAAALRDPAFWWLTGAFFAGTLTSVAVGVSLIPYLVARGAHWRGWPALRTAGGGDRSSSPSRPALVVLARRWP